jgi:hypothetical protein
MIWRYSPHIFWRRSGYKLGKEGALEAEKESMMIISQIMQNWRKSWVVEEEVNEATVQFVGVILNS